MTATSAARTVLASEEGLCLQSGPGRDLIFKVTGEDTGGAFDYFTVQVGRSSTAAGRRPPSSDGLRPEIPEEGA